MTTLFRSPNVEIDDVEWFVAVKQDAGRRARVIYRFRADATRMWRSVAYWPGNKPKGLRKFFRPYERAINVALRSAGQPPRLRTGNRQYGERRMQQRDAACASI